jgi:hypothetical protein
MATRVPALGEDALQVTRPEGSALVLTDAAREIVVVLECGGAVCTSADELLRLGKIVAEGMPAAAAAYGVRPPRHTECHCCVGCRDCPGVSPGLVDQWHSVCRVRAAYRPDQCPAGAEVPASGVSSSPEGPGLLVAVVRP